MSFPMKPTIDHDQTACTKSKGKLVGEEGENKDSSEKKSLLGLRWRGYTGRGRRRGFNKSKAKKENEIKWKGKDDYKCRPDQTTHPTSEIV